VGFFYWATFGSPFLFKEIVYEKQRAISDEVRNPVQDKQAGGRDPVRLDLHWGTGLDCV
jgi:hypothetical protein